MIGWFLMEMDGGVIKRGEKLSREQVRAIWKLPKDLVYVARGQRGYELSPRCLLSVHVMRQYSS